MNEYEEDERLRWQLRALRRDVPPPRDLWPQIAGRIQAAQAAPVDELVAKRARRLPRWLPTALAASLLLAFGWVWQSNLTSPPPAQEDALIRREAVAMSRHYEGAFAELPPARPGSVFAPALQDLDQSAAQILAAIDHDPNARFLLERLRRTYAQRLALAQRAALT